MKYRIAVTTTDGILIDIHFGHARQFHIYELAEDGSISLLEVRDLPPVTEEDAVQTSCHGHNDKNLSAVAELVKDCTYLLTARVGPRAQRGLQRKKVSVMETEMPVNEALKKCYEYLSRQNIRRDEL